MEPKSAQDISSPEASAPSMPAWGASPADAPAAPTAPPPTESVTATSSGKSSSGIPKILLILIGIALIGGLILVGSMVIKPKTSPKKTVEPAAVKNSEAAFNLFVSSPNVEVGSKVKVSVLVKSDTDAANLFVAKLKFPADLLAVESIDLKPKTASGTDSGFIKDWFINNWVENNYDNVSGIVSLVGGVPTPGHKTEAGGSGSLMADIYFTALKNGDATISFDNTSAIYRDSDNINILSTKKEVTLKITGTTPVPESNIKGDVNSDGKLNLVDMSALMTRWGVVSAQIERADLNDDKMVNTFDYGALMQILKEKGVLESRVDAPEASASGTPAPQP